MNNPLIVTNTITGETIFKSLPVNEEVEFDGGMMITETDTRGIITYANKKFREMTGFTRKELIGSPHNINRHPDMPKGAFRGMWKVISQKKHWRGYVKNMRKDGKYYWVLVYIQPKLDENGELIGFIAVRKAAYREKIKEMEELGIISPVFQVLMEIEGREVPVKVWNISEVDWERIQEYVRWKEEKLKESKERRRKNLSRTMKELHEKVRNMKREKEQLITVLKAYHPFLEYALYLYHLNHYAKTPRYAHLRGELYRLKEKVLRKAYNLHSDLFTVAFIERGDRVVYCEECKERAYEEWKSLGGYSWMGPFGWFLKEFSPCERCTVHEDYYSLVELTIATPLARFTFHLPYPEVKDLFPKDALPKGEGGEEEVRFGREVKKYEALVYPLKEVKQKLLSFLEEDGDDRA